MKKMSRLSLPFGFQYLYQPNDRHGSTILYPLHLCFIISQIFFTRIQVPSISSTLGSRGVMLYTPWKWQVWFETSCYHRSRAIHHRWIFFRFLTTHLLTICYLYFTCFFLNPEKNFINYKSINMFIFYLFNKASFPRFILQ